MTRMEVIAEKLAALYGASNPDMRLHGLEIGCLNGDFDVWLLEKYPNMRITSIDPHPNDIVLYRMLNDKPKIAERFRLIKSTSDDAIKYLERIYHFVFIDGEHSYEQTRRDILNYWQIVKKGGLLAGHNFEEFENCSHPGVAPAVNEIFGKGNFILGDDITWIKYV